MHITCAPHPAPACTACLPPSTIRDIKLENILLDCDSRMKLIDFGLSAFYVPGKRLRVHCGSPSYAAPEIVARKAYEGPPVDVWSLGVVLFAMVAGYLPFHASGGNKQDLCNKIMAGTYTAPDWLSAPMRDLLARMLTVDPERRITFAEVWSHPWVRGGPAWLDRGVNIYALVPDVTAAGGLRCDEQVRAFVRAFVRAVFGGACRGRGGGGSRDGALPAVHCGWSGWGEHGTGHAQQQMSSRLPDQPTARPVSVPAPGLNLDNNLDGGHGFCVDQWLARHPLQVVAELEASGYPRPLVYQQLAGSEATYLTSSYFLLCEGKHEAMRKLRASLGGASSKAGAGGGGPPVARSAPGSFTAAQVQAHQQQQAAAAAASVAAAAAAAAEAREQQQQAAAAGAAWPHPARSSIGQVPVAGAAMPLPVAAAGKPQQGQVQVAVPAGAAANSMAAAYHHPAAKPPGTHDDSALAMHGGRVALVV